MLHEKHKEKITIKDGHVEEFNKIYQAMCNPIYQRKKNRNVSKDSPFDKLNIPPREYLEHDYEIAKSPNKINAQEMDASKIPLAGRITQIGQKILDLGSRKAK